MVTRRLFLGGALASTATAALAAPPSVSLRPMTRPGAILRRSVPSIDDILARADLAGQIGFAVADARTGEMLEVLHPLRPMPPASVAKAVTCAYALDRLGPEYRFATRVLADGTITEGRLDGDLWLIGAGDPLLDTTALAGLVAQLQEAGLTAVSGRLMVSAGALPEVYEIDPMQLDHAGYNPSISGLNLNFNRVHFEWDRGDTDYTVTMQARSDTLSPDVRIARMQIAERTVPVYTFERGESFDQWTVARGALGDRGARWLPVRRPAAYLAEVFQTVARASGLRLEEAAFSDAVPTAALELARHDSPPLEDILRGMMRWSTNLTAEVVGLKATLAGGVRPVGLADSAAEMSAWMRERLGARQAYFVDHSGLGDQSRVRPQDMTHALVAAGADGQLRALMKDIPILDANGAPMPDHPVRVVAKTGTLNFVSTLAGYLRTPDGRDLAFTIFCGDTDRRAALTEAERERPPGARTYNGRAKMLQQALLQRWGAFYGMGEGGDA